MSDTITLDAQSRSETGTRAVRRLRRDGKLPAVVYGHGEGAVPVTLHTKSVTDALKHGAHLFDLNLDGKSEKVLIKDAAFDVYGTQLLHLDLTRVSLDENITTTVPVEMVGEAPGEKTGGVVAQKYADIEIECRADRIPDKIEADISNLGMGDNLHVGDLNFPEGVSPVPEAGIVVVHIAPPRVVETDEDEQAATEETGNEPEVLTEKKSDEDAEG